jgi:hypothetical protein
MHWSCHALAWAGGGSRQHSRTPSCTDERSWACCCSGGTPVLLFAFGKGFEGRDDIGLVYTCR